MYERPLQTIFQPGERCRNRPRALRLCAVPWSMLLALGGVVWSGAALAQSSDYDADGIPDASDNCPRNSNPGQEDRDGDGVGSACEELGAPVQVFPNETSVSSQMGFVWEPAVPGELPILDYDVQLSSSLAFEPLLVDQKVNVDFAAQVSDASVGGQSGENATFSSVSGGLITVTGANGFSQADVGRVFVVGNASNGANRGRFEIDSYVSPSSVRIQHSSGAAESGSIDWAVEDDFEVRSMTSGAFQDVKPGDHVEYAGQLRRVVAVSSGPGGASSKLFYEGKALRGSSPQTVKVPRSGSYQLPVTIAIEAGTYFWRVRANDADGPGTWSTRQVKRLNTDIRYSVQVAVDGSFQSSVYEKDDIPGTSVSTSHTMLSEIGPGTTYFWRVVAEDRAGQQTASNTHQMSLNDIYGPTPSALIYPAEDAELASNKIVLTWEKGFDESGLASYSVEIASDASFSTIVHSRSGLSPCSGDSGAECTRNGYETYFDAGTNLERGKTYYARVTSTDTGGYETVGPSRKFHIGRRNTVYTVRVEELGQLAYQSPEVDSATTHTALMELEAGITYSWSVTAKDVAGNTRVAGPRSFPLADVFPPRPAEAVFPLQDAIVLTQQPWLIWEGVPSVAHFEVVVSKSQGLDSPVVETTVSPQTSSFHSVQVSTLLERGEKYYWRVKSVRDNGAASDSAVFSFVLDQRAMDYSLEVTNDGGTYTTMIYEASPLRETRHTIPETKEVPDGVPIHWRVRATDPAGNERLTPSNTFQLPDIYGPVAPILTLPASGATVVSSRTGFRWEPVNDKGTQATYRFELARSGDFTDLLAERDNLTTPGVILGTSEALTPGTYHWRVFAVDASGNLSRATADVFEVDAREVQYTFTVSESADLSAPVVQRPLLTTTSLDLNGAAELPEETQLYWGVTAVDGAGNQRASSVYSMYLADQSPPTAPELLYPADGTEILASAPCFTWGPAEDTSSLSYSVEYSKQSDFAVLLGSADNIGENNRSYCVPASLERNTGVFWRVTATDIHGQSTTTGPSSFLIRPKIPTYQLEVSTTNAFASVAREVEVADTRFELGIGDALEEGTWYWRVRAVDEAGNRRLSSDVGVFSLADIYPPVEVGMVFPRDNGVTLTTTPTIAWEPFMDTNGPIRYSVRVSDSASFDTVLAEGAGLTTSSFTVPAAQALVRGSRYYVQISATDAFGNEGTGRVHPFRVDPRAVQYVLTIREKGSTVPKVQTGDLTLTSVSLTDQGFTELDDSVDYEWFVTATDGAGNTRLCSATFEFQIADVFPPTLPALEYPRDQSTVENNQVAFMWGQPFDSTGPITQTLEISTDNTFSSPLVTETVSGQGYALTSGQALPRGKSYYWRLRLSDGLGNASVTPSATFFVAEKQPIYTLEIFEGSDAGVLAVSADVVGETSVTLTQADELRETRNYVWKVRAEDKAGNSRMSTQTFSFLLEDNYPPREVGVVFPREGDTVLSNRPSLAWEPFVDESGPLSYRVQISSSDGFVNMVLDQDGIPTPGFALPAGTVLERGRKYFYRIGATDSRGNTGFGTVHSFFVDAREMNYEISISEQASQEVVVRTAGLTNTELTLDGLFAGILREGISYDWTVSATDPAGNQRNAASTFSFAIADIFPPESPDLLYPIDGAVVENDQAGFLWEQVADGTPPVTYELQIADDASFSNLVLRQETGEQAGYQLSTAQSLDRGETYHWRLLVKDGADNQSLSESRRFTVSGKTPNYVLEVYKTSITGENVVTIETGGMTQHALMGQNTLQDSQSYVWRVRAIDKAGNERPSNNIFRLELADSYPPVESAMIFPRDGDYVLHDQPVIAWEPFADTNSPLTYEVRLSRRSDMTDVVLEATGLTQNWFGVPAANKLDLGATYYFRIDAIDPFGNRGFGTVHTFTVDKRDVFYSLTVSESDTGRLAVETSSLSEPRFSMSDQLASELRDAVAYEWIVNAQDAAGNQRQANALFRFQIADTFPPSAPDLEYPPTGAVVENPRIGFRWSEVRDATPPVAQQIEVSIDASFDTVVVQDTVPGEGGYQLNGAQVLNREQIYYWRLSLTDSLGNQRYTPSSHFTVAAKEPLYTVEVFENDPSGIPVIAQDVPGQTSLVVGVDKELKDSTPHYWRVRAADKAGNTRMSSETWTFTLADRYAPVEVGMVFPLNEGTSLSSVPTIAWEPFVDTNGPLTYRLQVSPSASFEPLTVDTGNLTENSYQLATTEALVRGHTYFLRVFASDQLGNEGVGAVHRFKVDDRSVRYSIAISDAVTEQVLVSSTDLTQTSYDLAEDSTSELADGRTYRWSVTATDQAGNYRSAVADFVFNIADVFPPSAPELQYPLQGDLIENDLIGFRWGDAVDATPPIRQRFELSDDSTFQTTQIVVDDVQGQGYALDLNQRLARGKTYFWRLVLTDALGNTAPTPAADFTVNTRDPIYTFEVFENDLSGSPVIQEEVMGFTSYAVTSDGTLEDSKQYVWRVNARDKAGNARDSNSTFRFELEDRYPPVEVGMVFPRDEGLVLSDQPIIVWEPFIDTHGPPRYRLQIATDQTFETLVVDAVDLNAPQYQVPAAQALPRGQTYHLRIYATDTLGNQGTGAAHIFSVDERAVSYGVRVVEQGTNRNVLQTIGLTETTLSTEEMISAQFNDGYSYRWEVDATDPAGNFRQAASAFVFTISDIFPPDAPAFEYPLAGATMENDEVGFRWSAVVDTTPPVSQTLQVASDEGFENIIRSVDVETGNGVVLADSLRLDRGAGYHWRLVLTDSLGNTRTTMSSPFTVESREPEYTLAILEGDETGLPVLEQQVPDSTSYTLTAEQALQETTPYAWRVSATDKAGNQRESELRNLLLADQYPPPLPELLYPLASSRSISRTPGFLWESVFDPSGVQYDLEVSSDADFASFAIQIVDLDDAGWAGTAGYQLERGVEYYWRVRVRDDQGYEDVTPASRFTVDGPAVSYLLEVEEAGQVEAFAAPKIRYEVVGATSFDMETLAGVELDEGRTYNWRVTATDGSQNSRVANDTFTFNLADQFPPAPGKLIFPADGAGVLNPTVGFSWEPSLDISTPVTYTLELLDQVENGQVLEQYTDISSTSFALPYTDRLPRGVDYYWRVRSRDALGNESVSDVGNFSVQSKALRYDLVLAGDESMTDVKMRYVNLYVPTFTLPEAAELDDDVPYFWDVKVTDGAGNETMAGNAPYRFQLADIYPPSEVRLRYPKRAAVVLDTRPGFAWESYENPLETIHRFELSDGVDFANILHSYEGNGLSGYQLPSTMELNRGQSYFWRVSSRDLNDNEVVGEASAFGVSRSAVRYELEVALDDEFSNVVRNWGDLEETRQVTPVDEAFPLNTDHYWRVRAVKTMTTGDESKSYRIEGETLGISCGPVDENTETGQPAYLSLCSNGFAGSNFPIPVPGNYRIRFRAAADHAPNDGELPDIAPLMRFSVASRTVEEVRLLETDWTTYETTTRLEGGNNQIGVSFVNDYYSEEKGDRNVRLDWIEVEGPLEAIENIRKEQLSETRTFNIRTLSGMVEGGLLASYYDDVELGGENPSAGDVKHRRIDGPIDFPLSADRDVYGDFATGLGGDTFSVRWEGWVKADVSGEYAFFTTTNDGQRFWVNGTKLVEDWNVQTAGPAEHTSTVTLAQGWNSIRFDMFDNLGPAFARLEYRPPGGTRQLVPATALGIMGDPNESLPPVITDYYVSGVAPGFAAVSVSTDELTQITVEYGATEALGRSVTGPSFELQHRVKLPDPPAGSMYYRVTAKDVAGNETQGPVVASCTPLESDIIEGQIRSRYYSGRNFDTLRVTHSQDRLVFYGPATEVANVLGNENFSVHTNALFKADLAGSYTFEIVSVDGHRATLDGEQSANAWLPGSRNASTFYRSLSAGWHPLDLDFTRATEASGTWRVDVRVATPGQSLAVPPSSRMATLTEDFLSPQMPEAMPRLEVEALTSTGTEVTLEPPALLDCRDPNPLVVSNAPASFPVGRTVVTWTATNRFDEQSVVQQEIVVRDTTPPTIEAGPDLTLGCDAPYGDGDTPTARVQLNVPQVSDNGDPNPQITTDAPEILPLGGPTVITVTATDSSGNQSTDSYNVTVIEASNITVNAGPTKLTIPEARSGQCDLGGGAQGTPFLLRTPVVSGICNVAGTIDVAHFLKLAGDSAYPLSGSNAESVCLRTGTNYLKWRAVVGSLEGVTEIELEVVPTDFEVVVDSSPVGWTNADAQLDAHLEGGFVAIDGSGSLNMSWQVRADAQPTERDYDAEGNFSATFGTEAVYCPVNLFVVDASGNVGASVEPCFGVDKTKPAHNLDVNHTWVAANDATLMLPVDGDDLATYPHRFTGEHMELDFSAVEVNGLAQSGLTSVQISLVPVNADGTEGNAIAMNELVFTPEGRPATGKHVARVNGCNAAPCEDGPDGKRRLDFGLIDRGYYRVDLRITDRAGNVSLTKDYLRVVDFKDGLEAAYDWVEGQLLNLSNIEAEDDLFAASSALETASRLHISAPEHSLRLAKNAYAMLRRAEVFNDEPTPFVQQYLPRGAKSEVRRFAETFADRGMTAWKPFNGASAYMQTPYNKGEFSIDPVLRVQEAMSLVAEADAEWEAERNGTSLDKSVDALQRFALLYDNRVYADYFGDAHRYLDSPENSVPEATFQNATVEDLGRHIARTIYNRVDRVDDDPGIPDAARGPLSRVKTRMETFANTIEAVADGTAGDFEFMQDVYLNAQLALEELARVEAGSLATEEWRAALSVVLSYAAHLSLFGEDESLARSADTKDDRLVKVAQCRFQDFIHQLSENDINAAVETYRGSRCLIIAVYNEFYGGQSPDNQCIHPNDYDCPGIFSYTAGGCIRVWEEYIDDVWTEEAACSQE